MRTVLCRRAGHGDPSEGVDVEIRDLSWLAALSLQRARETIAAAMLERDRRVARR